VRLNNRLLPAKATRPQSPRCSADSFSSTRVEEDSQPSAGAIDGEQVLKL